MRYRYQIVHEDAGDDMVLRTPVRPEFIVRGRVSCGYCSTSHEPYDKTDPYPQCPWCGNIIDLTGTELIHAIHQTTDAEHQGHL